MIMIQTSEHTDGLGKQMVRERQDRFIESFCNIGTIMEASKGTGIHRDTVYGWYESDAQGFRQRMDNARLDFAERVESVLFHEVFSPKPNPILVIFANKAHNRAKYGDNITVTNDHAAELLSAVRGLPSGTAQVVEGTVVAVEEEVRRAVNRD